MRELAAIFERILVRHGDDLIVNLRIERLRHEARADALDLVRAGLALREHGARRRLDSDNVHVLILLLEIAADARQRAARADARDERRDLAVRVLPDLRARRRLMRRRVRLVRELRGDEGMRRRLRELLRLRNRALHALAAVREDDLRAVGLEQVAALDAHRLRHREDGAVAAGRRDRGETDARIARRRLDDDAARLELALLLRLLDHRLRDAVLDGSRRVEILQLDEDIRLEAIRLDEIIRPEQRRMTDELRNVVVNLTHEKFLLADDDPAAPCDFIYD